MNKAIVSTRTATELLATNAETEVKVMVHKIMQLTSGGRKLNSQQAVELAVFCFMTDLNPFNGEAYYMPGAGPIPGVAGVRRKAGEFLELKDANDRFFVDVRDANPGEGFWDPDAGDIASVATVRIRSVSDAWKGAVIQTFGELKDAGMDVELAWDRAEKLNGPEPTWSAVGVVDHRESFGREPGTKGKDDPGTPDKWDRRERCEKRAEKWALRKAFPSVILPDRELGDQDALVDPTIIEGIVREVTYELANPPEPRSEGEILNELGFEVDKPTETPSRDAQDAPKQSEPVEPDQKDELPRENAVETEITITEPPERPYPPEFTRERIREIAEIEFANVQRVTTKTRQMLRYGLELCFAGDENATDKRHTVLDWLVGDPSTTNTDPALVKAILKWLDPKQDDGGEYHVNPQSIAEAQAIFTAALADEGQASLGF